MTDPFSPRRDPPVLTETPADPVQVAAATRASSAKTQTPAVAAIRGVCRNPMDLDDKSTPVDAAPEMAGVIEKIAPDDMADFIEKMTPEDAASIVEGFGVRAKDFEDEESQKLQDGPSTSTAPRVQAITGLCARLKRWTL